MGEIVDYAAEYATVQRLSEMLNTTKEDYRATEAYALFTAILCWVMQRARTPEHHNGYADQQAQTVRAELENFKAHHDPWSVDTHRDISAFQFFKEIRNAVAHGDARRIKPINHNKILVGYRFECHTNNGNQYLGAVDLKRADMVRLGTALADLFCKAMIREPGVENVAADAAQIMEEAAA